MIRRTIGFLKLMRIPNGLMAIYAVIIGALIAGKLVLSAEVLLFALSAFLITSGGNAINDYYDVHVDTKNKPWRPIPSGAVKLKEALFFSAVLFGAGVLVPLILFNPLAVIIAVMGVLGLWYYSKRLKWGGMVGNVTTSIIVGMTYWYGWVVYQSYQSVVFLTLILVFLLSVLMSMDRELVKVIHDRKADLVAKPIIKSKRGFAPKTIATERGPRYAAKLALMFSMGAVALSPLPYFIGIMNELYVVFVYPCVLLFLLLGISIYQDYSVKNAKRLSLYVKGGMIFALIAFTMGLLDLPSLYLTISMVGLGGILSISSFCVFYRFVRR